MKIFLIFLVFSTSLFAKLTFDELDLIRSFTNENSKSIVQNGTSFCNDYFKNNFSTIDFRNKNSFMCKFSEKRNRFYIYMISVDKKNSESLKDFCSKILLSWPDIHDHIDRNFKFQKKEYLNGFYIENFFYDRVIDFSNDYEKDQRLINNEINKFILANRNYFSENNDENNLLIEKQINKINKIYKKVISKSESDLDILITQILKDVVRYKIFVNDIKNFKSYSCNWKPNKDLEPYVKKEKYSDFENI